MTALAALTVASDNISRFCAVSPEFRDGATLAGAMHPQFRCRRGVTGEHGVMRPNGEGSAGSRRRVG
jgi:hypothetical protein